MPFAGGLILPHELTEQVNRSVDVESLLSRRSSASLLASQTQQNWNTRPQKVGSTHAPRRLFDESTRENLHKSANSIRGESLPLLLPAGYQQDSALGSSRNEVSSDMISQSAVANANLAFATHQQHQSNNNIKLKRTNSVLLKSDSVNESGLKKNGQSFQQQDDIQNLQEKLQRLIEKQENTLCLLQARSHKVLDVLDMFEGAAFNFQVQQDFERLKKALGELMFTLVQSSRNELLLGQQFRVSEKQSMDLSYGRVQEKNLKDKTGQLQKTVGLQDMRIRSLLEETNRLTRLLNIEKKNSNEAQKKVTNLEQRVSFILENNVNGAMNTGDALRGCLNNLLKENESLKRDLEYKLQELDRERGKNKTLNTVIQRLNKKIDNLLKQESGKQSGKGDGKAQQKGSGSEEGGGNAGSVAAVLFKSEDVDLLREFRIPNSLDFRLQGMSMENQNTMRDLIELGAPHFIRQVFQETSDENTREELVEVLAKQFVQWKEFGDKLNAVVRETFKGITQQSPIGLQLHLNRVLAPIIHCKTAILWLVDSMTGILYTHRYNNTTQRTDVFRILMDKGILQEVFQIKGAVNVQQCKNKPLYFYAEEQKSKTIDTSCLFVPVISPRGIIRGVLEFSESDTEIFSFDEEYCAIVLSKYLGWHLEHWTRTEAMRLDLKMVDYYIDSFLYLIESQNEEDFCLRVRKQVTAVLGISESQFLLVRGQNIVRLEFDYEDGALLRSNTFSTQHGIAGLVVRNEKGCIVSNVRSSTSFNKLIDLQSLLPIYTLPVISEKFGSHTVVGVLQIVLKQQIKSREDKDKLIDVEEELQGPDMATQSIIEQFAKTIASAFVMLDRKLNFLSSSKRK